MSIHHKQYNDNDYSLVYDFLLSNYTIDRSRGPEATFFEYSQHHQYHNNKHHNKNRLWFDSLTNEEKIVGFCAYEMNLGEAFFFNAPGYEYLFEEMIDYAQNNLKDENDNITLHIFSKQKELKKVAKDMGYKITEAWPMYSLIYLKKSLNYELKENNKFRFLKENEEIDLNKLAKCIHLGFDHSPLDEYDIKPLIEIANSPHKSKNLDVIVINEETKEYIAYAGVWLELGNSLAYLEPFCVVPQYRNQKIGASVITEVYRKTKKMGCKIMTGGVSEFYKKIGFEELYRDELWIKNNK